MVKGNVEFWKKERRNQPMAKVGNREEGGSFKLPGTKKSGEKKSAIVQFLYSKVSENIASDRTLARGNKRSRNDDDVHGKETGCP